jgi:hypothetical protein
VLRTSAASSQPRRAWSTPKPEPIQLGWSPRARGDRHSDTVLLRELAVDVAEVQTPGPCGQLQKAPELGRGSDHALEVKLVGRGLVAEAARDEQGW